MHLPGQETGVVTMRFICFFWFSCFFAYAMERSKYSGYSHQKEGGQNITRSRFPRAKQHLVRPVPSPPAVTSNRYRGNFPEWDSRISRSEGYVPLKRKLDVDLGDVRGKRARQFSEDLRRQKFFGAQLVQRDSKDRDFSFVPCKSRIVVFNLHKDHSEVEIFYYFCDFGNIERWSIYFAPGWKSVMAFFEFSDQASASLALQKMDGANIMGMRIGVDWCESSFNKDDHNLAILADRPELLALLDENHPNHVYSDAVSLFTNFTKSWTSSVDDVFWIQITQLRNVSEVMRRLDSMGIRYSQEGFSNDKRSISSTPSSKDAVDPTFRHDSQIDDSIMFSYELKEHQEDLISQAENEPSPYDFPEYPEPLEQAFFQDPPQSLDLNDFFSENEGLVQSTDDSNVSENDENKASKSIHVEDRSSLEENETETEHPPPIYNGTNEDNRASAEEVFEDEEFSSENEEDDIPDIILEPEYDHLLQLQESKSRIVVFSFDKDLKDSDFFHAFKSFGYMNKSLYLRLMGANVALFEFSEESTAANAIREMNGSILGSEKIGVDLCRNDLNMLEHCIKIKDGSEKVRALILSKHLGPIVKISLNPDEQCIEIWMGRTDDVVSAKRKVNRKFFLCPLYLLIYIDESSWCGSVELNWADNRMIEFF